MAFKANDKQLRRLEGAGNRFPGAVQHAAHMAGQAMKRTSQQGQAHGPKSGRLYGSHQASAPGEYSAPRTWALYNSTDYTVDSAHQFRVGVGTHYGGYQEFGTSRMAPRPNLENAYNEAKDEMERAFGAPLLHRILGGR